MKVLVNPNNSYLLVESDGREVYGVADRSATEFDVASPMFWVDVSDDIANKNLYYDPSDSSIHVHANESTPVEPD